MPEASAGPNVRDGFIEAPVKGPAAMMSRAMVSPIASGKIDFGARSSTAVPKITSTRKNVSTASIMIPFRNGTFAARLGVPFATAGPPSIATSRNPAIAAPTSCATQYHAPVMIFMRPVKGEGPNSLCYQDFPELGHPKLLLQSNVGRRREMNSVLDGAGVNVNHKRVNDAEQRAHC